MRRHHSTEEGRPPSAYARLVLKANAALLDGDATTCERLANKALALTNPAGDAWFLIGTSLLTRGKATRASKILKQAVESTANQTALLAYVLAIAFHRQGTPDAAKPFLPLIAWDPELWEKLGRETAFEMIRMRPRRPPPYDPAVG